MKFEELKIILKRLYLEYVKNYLSKIFLALVLSIIVALSTSSIAWLLDPAVKKIFIEKDKVLVEQNDFKIAENLIKKGYQIIFLKNLNIDIENYARSINCKYIFKNNKLIQV